MKIYVMTDMEGIAGMVNFVDYCRPESSKYYEEGKALTTEQTNAAVEGLLEAGAGEVLVVDGHGPGAIEVNMLHPEARVLTGRPLTYPFALDDTYDAAIIVGQHAKSNTDGGHLCHSGSFNCEDWLINGISMGEIGFNILMASYFDVPTVMLAGDLAACEEMKALIPSAETAAVVEGLKFGSAAGLTEEENKRFNVAAVHLQPRKAGTFIRRAACRSLEKINSVERFWIKPPYRVERIYRRTETQPVLRGVKEGNDFIEIMKRPFQIEPMK